MNGYGHVEVVDADESRIVQEWRFLVTASHEINNTAPECVGPG
jgi:hypothetical protein